MLTGCTCTERIGYRNARCWVRISLEGCGMLYIMQSSCHWRALKRTYHARDPNEAGLYKVRGLNRRSIHQNIQILLIWVLMRPDYSREVILPMIERDWLILVGLVTSIVYRTRTLTIHRTTLHDKGVGLLRSGTEQERAQKRKTMSKCLLVPMCTNLSSICQLNQTA